MAQMVERVLGKDEVTGSIPVSSSKKKDTMKIVSFFLCLCPQDTTSFCNAVANIIYPKDNIISKKRTQNEVALRQTVLCFAQTMWAYAQRYCTSCKHNTSH